MKKITESVLQRAVLDYLAYLSNSIPLYFFRSAAGQVKTEQGRMFKTGKPGCPDISVILRGRYIGLEIKTTTGRQSTFQKQAEKEIIAAGGEYHIIRCIDDLRTLLTAKLSN